MKQSKGVQVIILLTALAVGCIYAFDLRNDYYFFLTKKESLASIKDIKKIEGNNPYLLTINYFNMYLETKANCTIKVNGRYGQKIEDKISMPISIYYTKKSTCNIYLKDYNHPTFGAFILHHFVFIISLIAIFLFSKRILNFSTSLND